MPDTRFNADSTTRSVRHWVPDLPTAVRFWLSFATPFDADANVAATEHVANGLKCICCDRRLFQEVVYFVRGGCCETRGYGGRFAPSEHRRSFRLARPPQGWPMARPIQSSIGSFISYRLAQFQGDFLECFWSIRRSRHPCLTPDSPRRHETRKASGTELRRSGTPVPDNLSTASSRQQHAVRHGVPDLPAFLCISTAALCRPLSVSPTPGKKTVLADAEKDEGRGFRAHCRSPRHCRR